MTGNTSLKKVGLAGVFLALVLSGCGGGGGDRAEGVEPGPTPPNNPVDPPKPILPPSGSVDVADLTESDVVEASITGVTVASPPTVTLSLTLNGGKGVSGLSTDHIRASFARLQSGGEFETLDWSSLVATQEDPVCRSAEDVASFACTTFSPVGTDPADIPDSSLAVQDEVATGRVVRDQATTESGGELVENEDGTWAYTLQADPGDPAQLADVHRICLQLSLTAQTNNPCIDFVPQDLNDANLGEQATSLHPDFYRNYDARQVVTTDTCNTCHAKLAFHGGGRTELNYCVSCHNPGTTDANSENTVDMKVMIHRIHNGKNLPSVIDGKPYKIWGFRNTEFDYSAVSYPQNATQCTRCHAGQEDFDYAEENGLPTPRAVMTVNGHDWATYDGREACESCHDDKTNHLGGNTLSCITCHNAEASAGDVQMRHRDRREERADALSFHIVSATGLGPGEFPVVSFTLNRDGVPIDIMDADIFDGKLFFGVAWDAATDNTNEGISGFESLNIELNILDEGVALGDNVFSITSPVPVMEGQDTVQVMFYGHENDGLLGPVTAIRSEVQYYPSSAEVATPRREVADLEKCDSCHHRLAMTDFGHSNFHASPGENLKVCVSCHGPGLGFSDGTQTDFRVLVHGVHAGGFRETYYKDPKYGPDVIHFPGNLADCQSCHLPDTHTRLPTDSPPLKGGLTYTTAVAATCRSCHDGAVAAAHMEQTGGAVIDGLQAVAESAVETCEVCHNPGAVAGVDAVHER